MRRENKYRNDAHVGRLERELEKTARNLQIELQATQDRQPNFEAVSIEMLEEIERLFTQVDLYFEERKAIK